eukprot:CAMPEP_0170831094 /NCGR_PEP_ID=MMETSP0733-20121128/49786_1 /TAXON_ID=186038 /ORGANISM="Fragilariopsis kerguelensis, Strain L26-C5" /LENGTH=260 /DNA_ID=CAMNT_0011196651 /DNA_START=244 /DNA_END=1026 /DNA_ORIENTATION=+
MDEPPEFYSHSNLVGFALVVLELLVIIPVSAHLFPGPMAPSSFALLQVTLAFLLVAALKLYVLMSNSIDPFGYGMAYSFALMVLCVEVWFREDPELFNGSLFHGYPTYLFHRPGETDTKAVVPLSGYTRVFGAWHAGGVCLCFWMHVLAQGFPIAQQTDVALALGALWGCWAFINQWRSIYGAAQFCQTGILFHSVTGPGCGLMAVWMVWFWQSHRPAGALLQQSESVVLGTMAAFGLCTVVWLATHERQEVASEKKKTF